jgi:hypothetical protein
MSISAVSACDLFLTVTTEYSVSRPMPANSSCVLPRMRVGRPAISGTNRSVPRSSRGSTLYLTASISHRRCSSRSRSGCSADTSWAWLQSARVS